MVDPIPDLAGVRGFRFTGADQLFKVPPKITSVWLSGVGGGGAVPSGSFGALNLYGFANAPLAVEPGDHIRVRVGGRPDIEGRYEIPNSFYDREWKLSTVGGWNGGGKGGGTWGGDWNGFWGEFHACGGGGATTFHHIPKGSNPLAVEGDLVAVAPGQGGTVRGYFATAGWLYRPYPESGDEPPAYDILVGEPLGPPVARSAVAFAGDPPPVHGAPEFLGAGLGGYSPPTSVPPTPTWHVLPDPFGDVTLTSAQDVSLGNPGESFRGGPGRWFSGAAATAGGGGGYGGGASGSRLNVEGDDDYESLPEPTTVLIDIAQGARHGGLLVPVDEPGGWGGSGLSDGDTIATVEMDDVEANLTLISGPFDPFEVYDFDNDDVSGRNIDTMLGHGSARIQWAADPKRARWRVGRVGWGRNNGW